MFTFFIGERNHREVRAQLYVNNNNIVDAIAEPIADQHDIQGGNTAVVRLATGDIVWINVIKDGSHVEGSNIFRYSSFTGLYLYP